MFNLEIIGNTTNGDYMLYKKLKKDFNESSDLKHKEINNVHVVYLESLCSSDKVNEYILQNLTIGHEFYFLKNIVSGPNIVYVSDYNAIKDYIMGGFALVYNEEDILVCECKGDLYRSVNTPTSEPSVNGPKDSFNESIQMNLGLIKRRIKTENLVNEDFSIGRKTKTQVSLLYISDIAKKKYVKNIKKKLKNIDIDGLVDVELLPSYIGEDKSPLPTIMKTERPDKVCTSLLEGKIVIIADNSPYALIMPAFFVDFINPQGDIYVKAVDVNFFKILRILCLFVTLILPALYISIINYNPETIPLNLLLSFQSARSGVPFPSAFEAIFMIIICSILRESDIRFPSNYGSSISILGALILGEAAVSANVASPIMIIIIGITFITSLVFNSGDVIDGLKVYRLILLFIATILGLYGMILGLFLILIHISSMKTLDEPYLYPVAPFDKTYLFKTVLKKGKDTKRSKVLSNNEYKVKQ